MEDESFVYTCCPGWGDHEYCAIKTIVRDGRIVRTEPPCYTGPEAREGYICQKGVMAGRQPYNEKRLTHPLKRAGARGEGKWERISWNQALDEIAAKLLELREAHGPESLAMWDLVASVPPAAGLAAVLSTRFIGLWGATDPIVSYGLDNGPFYAAYFDMGDFNRYCTTDPANFDGARFIIVWGANPRRRAHGGAACSRFPPGRTRAPTWCTRARRPPRERARRADSGAPGPCEPPWRRRRPPRCLAPPYPAARRGARRAAVRGKRTSG